MEKSFLTKKKLPDESGVYLFLGKNKKILYIGKATSIRDRVKSYFNKDIASMRGPLVQTMVVEAKNISYKKTDSVLEALILEANLIKKHKPIYNTKEKDDKSFNYIIITKEDYPRVLIIREKELLSKSFNFEIDEYFGPFPYGNILKEALVIVRKIFPFRDRCKPYDEKKKTKPCFNRQIGLCPGVCSGEISKIEYRKNIRNLILFFRGKKKILLRKLELEMRKEAKMMEFEKASRIKKNIFALNHIRDVSLMKKEEKRCDKNFRIEAYDVAHISGAFMVGVMVVLNGSEIKKSNYRKFKIKSVYRPDDTKALKEILERRLEHSEWDLPRLIVVDGGKAQINVVLNIFKKYGLKIPIVGVVKDERHRPKYILGSKKLIEKYESEILLSNNEAHRFAIAYHKKLRDKL